MHATKDIDSTLIYVGSNFKIYSLQVDSST